MLYDSLYMYVINIRLWLKMFYKDFETEATKERIIEAWEYVQQNIIIGPFPTQECITLPCFYAYLPTTLYSSVSIGYCTKAGTLAVLET